MAFVRGAEVNELAAGIADARVRALVRYGLATIVTTRSMSTHVEPRAEIDLLLFAEALRAMGTTLVGVVGRAW